MYESHWKLARRPFEHGADPAAYYPAEPHQAALLKLRYALDQHCGAALLAGAPGCGKTLLVNLLASRAAPELSPIVQLPFSQLSAEDLLAYLAAELPAPTDAAGAGRSESRSVDESVRRIGSVLRHNAAQGRHAVLVIDEAHLIATIRAWEALRLLLNFESNGQPDATLLIVGQPNLLALMARMPQWEERLAVKCLLRPLTVEETMSYVEHRLALAGARKTIFTHAALEAAHRASRGVPRRINRLCDLALLVGFADEQSSIGIEQIDAVSAELETISAD